MSSYGTLELATWARAIEKQRPSWTTWILFTEELCLELFQVFIWVRCFEIIAEYSAAACTRSGAFLEQVSPLILSLRMIFLAKEIFLWLNIECHSPRLFKRSQFLCPFLRKLWLHWKSCDVNIGQNLLESYLGPNYRPKVFYCISSCDTHFSDSPATLDRHAYHNS